MMSSLKLCKKCNGLGGLVNDWEDSIMCPDCEGKGHTPAPSDDLVEKVVQAMKREASPFFRGTNGELWRIRARAAIAVIQNPYKEALEELVEARNKYDQANHGFIEGVTPSKEVQIASKYEQKAWQKARELVK